MAVEKLGKKSLILIFIFLVLISLLVSLCSLSFKEKKIKGLETKIENLEKELSLLKSLPSPGISGSEELGAGKIGEIEEKISALPPLIFNTTGEVKEIKENGVIALGSGSNFTDQEPRELTLQFTKATSVFEKDKKKSYTGLEGLKYLKPQMEILIEGDENIRGKTEFKVKTINILSP